MILWANGKCCCILTFQRFFYGFTAADKTNCLDCNVWIWVILPKVVHMVSWSGFVHYYCNKDAYQPNMPHWCQIQRIKLRLNIKRGQLTQGQQLCRCFVMTERSYHRHNIYAYGIYNISDMIFGFGLTGLPCVQVFIVLSLIHVQREVYDNKYYITVYCRTNSYKKHRVIITQCFFIWFECSKEFLYKNVMRSLSPNVFHNFD